MPLTRAELLSQTALTNGPISTATQTALNAKADSSSLSAKADLVGGKLSTSQVPDLAISDYLGSVASEAALIGLVGQKGDWAIRTDNSTTWVIVANTGSQISDWVQLATPAGGGGGGVQASEAIAYAVALG